MKYNKQVARDLLTELQELLKDVPGAIDKSTDDGPKIDICCRSHRRSHIKSQARAGTGGGIESRGAKIGRATEGINQRRFQTLPID